MINHATRKVPEATCSSSPSAAANSTSPGTGAKLRISGAEFADITVVAPHLATSMGDTILPMKHPDSSRDLVSDGPDRSNASAAADAGHAAADVRALLAGLLEGEHAEQLALESKVKLANSYALLAIPRGDCSDEASRQRSLVETWHSSGHADPTTQVLSQANRSDIITLLPSRNPISRPVMRDIVTRALTRHGTVFPQPIAMSASQDWKDIPAALSEARLVLEITQALGYPSGIYQLDDVAIEVSLLRSPDLARLLVLRIEPLHHTGMPLVETLIEYLRSGHDRQRTAAALHIHPNTLDYRLRRVRDLTGLALTTPRDAQVLTTALIAWRLSRFKRMPLNPGVRGLSGG